MTEPLRPGLHDCPLCDEPPPHSHQLPPIFNGRYYCPDGTRHVREPRRWWQRRPRCNNCGQSQLREKKTP